MKNLGVRQRIFVVAVAVLQLGCTAYYYTVIADSYPQPPGVRDPATGYLDPGPLGVFIMAFFRAIPISLGVTVGAVLAYLIARGVVRWVVAGKTNNSN